MARVELLVTVDKLITDSDLVAQYLSPANGASVQVNVRSTGSPATVYAGETGGTTVSNPLVTDAQGRVNGWVDEGSYTLGVSGAGITSYNQPYEAVRGDGISNIVDNAVGLDELADILFERFFQTGDIKLTTKAAADSGWVLCNGQAVSRGGATAALFSILGTTFGAGDGSTTFNVPDLRGRVPVGPDGGAGRITANNTMGAVGGAQTHQLTSAESGMPTHGHGHTFGIASAGAHTHALSINVSVVEPGYNLCLSNSWWTNTTIELGTSNVVIGDLPQTAATAVITYGTGDHTHTGTATSAGSHAHSLTGGISNAAGVGASSAHNNVQPYQVVQFQIKL